MNCGTFLLALEDGDEHTIAFAEEALKVEPRYSDNVYLHALVVLCQSRKTKADCVQKLREAARLCPPESTS